MSNFDQFNLSKQLNDALEDLNFKVPTPIQAESFPVILSGKNLVGIAQTGTGKTLAYGLPILHGLKFSKQVTPRILILVPTRELVIQVVDQMNSFAKYVSIRMLGVYGGTCSSRMRRISSYSRQIIRSGLE
jgi:ATP-dependent RNA helicase RhlE